MQRSHGDLSRGACCSRGRLFSNYVSNEGAIDSANPYLKFLQYTRIKDTHAILVKCRRDTTIYYVQCVFDSLKSRKSNLVLILRDVNIILTFQLIKECKVRENKK